MAKRICEKNEVKITKEQIQVFIDLALQNPKKATPAMSFLTEAEVDKAIKKLVESKVSFSQISKAIFQVFTKKISANTIKIYCVNKGYYTIKQRQKRTLDLK